MLTIQQGLREKLSNEKGWRTRENRISEIEIGAILASSENSSGYPDYYIRRTLDEIVGKRATKHTGLGLEGIQGYQQVVKRPGRECQ